MGWRKAQDLGLKFEMGVKMSNRGTAKGTAKPAGSQPVGKKRLGKTALEFSRADVRAAHCPGQPTQGDKAAAAAKRKSATSRAAAIQIAGQARNDTKTTPAATKRQPTAAPPTPTPTPKSKRPLMMLAVVLAVICALAGGGTAVWAYSYNNSHDLSWYLNSPDASEFTISTNGQLHAFSALVNGDALDPAGQPLPAQSFAGKTVRMSTGLNLFDIEFTPIGSPEHPFSGSFVGKSIQRLKISSPSKLQNVGLFGFTSDSAQIQGVQLAQNCNIILTTSSAAVKINNIGGIVGNNNGTISDCSSAARISVEHTAVDISVADGNDGKPVINNIGGVVGLSSGSITNTSHSGKLELFSPANAYNSPESLSSFNLYVIENVGGVAGYTSAYITATQNSGIVYAVTTGKGATDRFNVAAYSRSHHVGGIVGSSVANISNCSNSGPVFTTGDPAQLGNPQADLAQLGKEPTGTALLKSPGGAAGIGGIVGNFRHLVGSSEIAANLTDDGMLPGAPIITVSDCSNTGFINGVHVTGGIVGGAGSNTVVTRCTNGIAGQPDVGTVRSTRWNKPCTGGVVSQSTGIVSYSRNHALVTNTNIGHYNGGVAGLLAQYDRQPFKAEIFGCYSTGPVRGPWSGGLVGRNYAYVHDNLFLYGTVGLAGADANQTAVFANEGIVSNTSYAYETQAQAMDKKGVWIKSGEAVAILNQIVSLNNWASYYFIAPSANNGYPVLNGQAPNENTTDLSLMQADVSLVQQASYAIGYNPMPILKASIVVNGKTVQLRPDVDFRVLSDPEALDASGVCKGVTNGATPYQARIQGIGLYSGSPAAAVAYGILKADLSKCRVVVANATYNGSVQNQPKVALVDPYGVTVPEENYSLEINNGNDCLEVKDNASNFYPVIATAHLDSNYTGFASGIYSILKANIYADCDLVGIYLEDHTVNGQAGGPSVWLFDDLVSKIYEVTPLLGQDGELQWVKPQPGLSFNSPVFADDGSLLWQLCDKSDGVVLVEGLESYQQEGERVLLRATPKRTDANGNPVYGDLAVDYTGDAIQPQVIAVLFNGQPLAADQFNTYYGRYSDSTSRPLPLNTNATTNDEQPEASMVVYAQFSGNFGNYDYIDFKIRPIPANDDQIAIHYKDDQKLFYASGGCPMPPAIIPSGIPLNTSVDLRFYPDPDGADFKVISADQWFFEFHHAFGPDGQELGSDDLGYEPGSKVYFAIRLMYDASVIWRGQLIAEYTVASAGVDIDDNEKTQLSDAVIEVTGPAVYDPSLAFTDWLGSFEFRNTVTGETLRRGAYYYTLGTDYCITDNVDFPTDAIMPRFNPETGMVEGSFNVRATTGGKYIGTRTVSYQCQRPLFPRPGEGIFAVNLTRFLFGTSYSSAYANLPWCEDGWNVEQLSERLFLHYRLNLISATSWNQIEDLRVVAIYLDGKQVDAINELGKTYTIFARHVYNPESSMFAGDADPEALYQFTTSLNNPQSFTANDIQNAASNGYLKFRGFSLAQSEYMYTGFELKQRIWDNMVALDAHGNRLDPRYFEPVVVDVSIGGHGNLKDVGDYNVPKKAGNFENSYFDLHFTGDDVHFTRNVSTTLAVSSASGPRINREVLDGLVPVNLRFSIVPADISDPEKVHIQLDPVERSLSFFDAQSGEPLNYLAGAAGYGDYTLSWGADSAAQGYARITTSGNGNLVASAASDAYRVSQNQDGTWQLDILFNTDVASVNLAAASWDYASTLAVGSDGSLALPAVSGSYDGNIIPAAAYQLRLGVWDGQAFSEQTGGWSPGDSACLYLEAVNELICNGTAILPLTLVAPDPDKQFGPGFAGTVELAATAFTAKPATPVAAISFGGQSLVQGRDYQISSSSVNAGPGAGNAVVSGLGEYTGSYSYAFDILPADINDLELSLPPQPYSGAQIRPAAPEIQTLLFNGIELSSADWALDDQGYGENINVATGGSLRLLPGSSGNFSGSKTVPFAIAPKAFADDIAVAAIASQSYLGRPVTFTDASLLSLTDSASGYQLVYGQDFVISSYANNRNVGIATVYFSGTGNYAANNITADFSIQPVAFGPDMVQGILASYEYQGGSLQPQPQLLLGGQPLPTSDYQLEYGANDSIGIGSGWLKVTPLGNNLTGDAVTLNFDISADISKAQIEAIPNSSYVPGGSYQPDLQLAFNGQELLRDVHYTVSYDSYGAGAKLLTINGNAQAAVYGSAQESYAIDGRALTTAMITAPQPQDYSGYALQPQPLVQDGDNLLRPGVDYQLSYSNNTNVTFGSSRAMVSLHGIGNYAGLVSASFDINPRPLNANSLTAITAAGLWPGSGSVPANLGIYDSAIILDPQTNDCYRLVEGQDYTVSYQGNQGVGTAMATAHGIGNYSFDISADYLVKGNIAAAQLAPISQQAYTGAAVEPAVTLALGGQSLVLGSDYSLSYANNIAAGTASLTVSGLGLYEGSLSASFAIVRPSDSNNGQGNGDGNGNGNTGGNGDGGGNNNAGNNNNAGSGGSGGGGNIYNNYYYGSNSSSGTPAAGAATATATTAQQPKPDSPAATATTNDSGSTPQATTPPEPETPLAVVAPVATTGTELLPLPALIIGAVLFIVLVGALAHLYLRRRRLYKEKGSRNF